MNVTDVEGFLLTVSDFLHEEIIIDPAQAEQRMTNTMKVLLLIQPEFPPVKFLIRRAFF